MIDPAVTAASQAKDTLRLAIHFGEQCFYSLHTIAFQTPGRDYRAGFLVEARRPAHPDCLLRLRRASPPDALREPIERNAQGIDKQREPIPPFPLFPAAAQQIGTFGVHERSKS